MYRKSLSVAMVAGLPFATALSLNVDSTDSIMDASATIAYGLMTFYQNNQSSTPPTAVGTFNQPVYWWEAGAVWGGLIDYWKYTGDTSYNPTVTQALLAQVGPDNNYMPPAYFDQLGNDDQAFWAFACLSAAEYGFPAPPNHSNTLWIDLAEAVFNAMVSRWDTSTCGGGLRWQIFPSNAGYTYKNTVSNGGLFQIAARLYRNTGNHTYLAWAEKTWDWMSDVGLINDGQVFDGTNDQINCTQVDHVEWTYNPSMLIYGTSILYNVTGSSLWSQRTSAILTWIGKTFFSPYGNSTNIMFEPSCEPADICNTDEFSFKAYMSRWLSKSAVVAPYITNDVTTLLTASAEAAAKSCSGAPTGSMCGTKWYVGGYDGLFGPGQELSALETIQSLLLLRGNHVVPHPAPQHSKKVTITPASHSAFSSQTAPPKKPHSVSVSHSVSAPAATSSSAASSRTPRPHVPKPRGSVPNGGHRPLIEMMSWSMALITLCCGMVVGGVFV